MNREPREPREKSVAGTARTEWHALPPHQASGSLDPIIKTKTLTRMSRIDTNLMERHLSLALSPAEAERGEFQRDAGHTEEDKDQTRISRRNTNYGREN